MTGGLLLVIAGAFVLTQVLGGDALGRLGVAGAATTPGKKDLVNPGSILGGAVGTAAGGALH